MKHTDNFHFRTLHLPLFIHNSLALIGLKCASPSPKLILILDIFYFTNKLFFLQNAASLLYTYEHGNNDSFLKWFYKKVDNRGFDTIKNDQSF